MALLTYIGSPPVWSPPSFPPKLKEDSGDVFRDQNGARYSQYPYEPAVRAVFIAEPLFDTTSIDIVACGNTIGNLLRFVRSQERSFRFNFETIGNSIFFIRKENTPDELISQVYGYGHTFPEAYTTWEADVKGSTSHQRIIKYQFSGFRYLIRFEGDGYHKDKVSKSPKLSAAEAGSSSPKSGESIDIGSLQKAAASFAVSQQAPKPGKGLHVELRGQRVPQQAVFDLKTRSAKREIDMNEFLPRLWVSQIPNFVIAYHKSGFFDDVRKQEMYAKIREWETGNEKSLHRLNATIRRIKEIAEEHPGQGLELRKLGSGPLQIRKLLDKDWHALPEDLSDRWGHGATDLNASIMKPTAEEDVSTPNEQQYVKGDPSVYDILGSTRDDDDDDDYNNDFSSPFTRYDDSDDEDI